MEFKSDSRSAGFSNNLNVDSISCSDVNNCVAVGWYDGSNFASHALILTMEDGIWKATDAPVPSNSVPPGVPAGAPSMALFAVDCPQVDYCVTGGQYTDTNHIVQPLLDVWDSGVWKAVEGPVPKGTGYTEARVGGIACPTEGSCTAVGEYGGVNGGLGMRMNLLQDSWSASTAPSMVAVGCGADGFCASGGLGVYNDIDTMNSDGLLEVTHFNHLPYVSGVSPHSGPPGAVVTISGTGFAGTASVGFGEAAGTHLVFINSDKLEVLVPNRITCQVTISVTENGLTSGSSPSDLFTVSICGKPRRPGDVSARAGEASASVSFSPPAKDGGGAISAYSVAAYDESNSSNGGETAIGTGSPITVDGLTNGDTYRFEVRATNSVGTGSASTISNAVVPRK